MNVVIRYTNPGNKGDPGYAKGEVLGIDYSLDGLPWKIYKVRIIEQTVPFTTSRNLKPGSIVSLAERYLEFQKGGLS